MKKQIIYFVISVLCWFGTGKVNAQCSNYQPTITVNQTSVCSNNPSSVVFNFSVPTSAGFTHTWTQGANNLGTGNSINHSFSSHGTYTVTVSADSSGCIINRSINVGVHPIPSATFAYTPSATQCAPAVISFNSSVSSGTAPFSYSWDLGNGSMPTSANAATTYDVVGTGNTTYPISLTVTDVHGCTNTAPSQTVTIHNRPDANIIGNPVDFKNCSSTNADVTIFNNSSTAANNQTYTIDWGDGSAISTFPSSFVSTIHPYVPNSGYSTINYTITNTNGCQSSLTQQVFNGTNPDLNLNLGNSTGLCIPNDVTITIDTSKTNSNPPGTVYIVSVSDGSPDVTLPHPPPETYTHTFSAVSCGINTINYQNSYQISIKAENPCGSTTVTGEPITFGSTPTADFDQSDNIVCVNDDVIFTNTTSNSIFINFSSGNYVCDTTTNVEWSITPSTGWTSNNPSPVWFILPTADIKFTNAGTYDIQMIASNNCGSDTIVKQVCVVSPPQASFTIDQDYGCAPHTVQLTNTSNTLTECSASYSWTVTEINICNPQPSNWSFTNGTTASFIHPEFIFHAGGQYEIQLEVTNECGTDIFTDIITVAKPPTVSIAPIPNACTNTVVNPVATVTECNTTGTTYSWSFPGGTPSSSTLLNPGAIAYNTQGTKTITLIVSTNCGNITTNAAFTINPTPSVPALATGQVNNIFCEDDVITLQANNPAANIVSYSWSGPNGWTSTSQNPTIPNATPAHSGYYVLQVANNLNCSDQDSILVNINAVPVITFTAPTDVCYGENATITANTSGNNPTYNWLNHGLMGSTITVPIFNSGWHVVEVTDDEGCMGQDSVFINMIPLPTVNAGNDTAICYNPNLSIVTSFSGSPSGGTWSGMDIMSNGDFLPSATGVYTLVYTYTDMTTTCTNTDTVIVTVDVPQTVDAGNDTTICINSGTLMLSNYGSPPNGTWMTLSGMIITEFIPSAAIPTDLIYSYGAGTCQEEDTMTITVVNLPTVMTESDFDICQNDPPYDLTENPLGGTWSGTGLTDPATGTFDPSVLAPNTYTFTYTYTDGNGCENSDDVNVTVLPIPAVTTQDIAYCAVTTDITLINYMPSGGTWSGTGIVNAANGIFNSNGVTGTYEVYYSVTQNTCTVVDTMMIDVLPVQTPEAGTNIVVCEGDADVLLSGTPFGGIWEDENGIALADSTFTPSLAGNYTFYYIIAQGTTCEDYDSVSVLVNPLPIVNIYTGDTTICEDSPPFTLQTNVTNGTWSGTGITDPANGIFDALQSGVGTFPITIDYGDANGCTNTDSIIITVTALPVITIQNAITYCEDSSDISLPTPSPTGGTWTGTGIVDGTAGLFNAFQAGANGQGIYTVYYCFEDAFSCQSCDSMVITIQAPASVDAGANDTLCLNDGNWTLTGFSPTGGTWTGMGITNASGTFNTQNAGAGTHTLTYEVVVGSCTLVTTKTILVVGNPTVNVGNDVSVCIDDAPFVLSGFSPLGGMWSGTGLVNDSIFDPNLAGQGPHTLTYTYHESINNCAASDDVIITVNPLPTVNIDDSITYCLVSAPQTLPTPNPTGGTWSGIGITDATLGHFTPSSTPGVGVYTITYTYTNPTTMCVNSDSMQVRVIEADSINAGVNIVICQADAPYIPTNYFPTTGGTWSGTGITNPATGEFDPSALGGDYIITYEIGTNTCLVSDTTLYTVIPTPSPTAGNDTIACIDSDTIALTSYSPTDGFSYWTGTGVVLDSFHFFAGDAGTGTHTLTFHYYEPIHNCYATATKDIVVNDLPAITLADSIEFCLVPTPQTLPTPNSTGGTWSGVGITNGTLGEFTPTMAGLGLHTVYYIYTHPTILCTNLDSMLIRVIEADSINAGIQVTFCQYDAPYTPTNYFPTSGGTWSGTGIINTATGEFDPNLPAGSYIITYEVGTGTCLVSDTTLYTIIETPILNPGADTAVCESDSAFILTGFSPTIGTYFWTGIGIIDSIGIFDPQVSGVGVFIDTFHYREPINECYNFALKTITVNALPNITLQDSIIYCDVDYDITLPTPSPSGGFWFGQGISDPSGLFNPDSLNGPDFYDVYYEYTDGNSCTNWDTLTIQIIPIPFIDAGITDTICIDEGLFTLGGYAPLMGTWSGLGIVDPVNGIFDPTITGSGLHTITYTIGTGTCLIQDNKAILVIDLNNVTAGPNEEACITDAPFALSGFAPSGGIWSGTGIIDSVGAVFDPSVGAMVHTVTYTYTDPVTGCDTSRTKTVTIWDLPTVDFSVDTLWCVNVPLPFTNNTTNAISYFWDFGNGDTSIATNPTYTYPLAGTYTITLVATSQHGCIDSTSNTIIITAPPISSFDLDSIEGCAPLPVNITNTSFAPYSTFFWDFGNGNTSTFANPPAQVYLQGTSDTMYFITLTVTNLCGVSTDTNTITVFPTPQVDFVANVSSGCSPLTVDFLNLTVGEPDTFYWDFGDGHQLTTVNQGVLSHTFYTDSLPSTYTVSLIAKNDCGYDTLIQDIYVQPTNVQSFFTTDSTMGCEPFTVTFNNYSTPGAVIIWDFGDGFTDTAITNTVTHTYTYADTFEVVQYVIDCGFDSSTIRIIVREAPDVSFSAIPQACPRDTVSFTNLSIGTSASFWDFGDGTTSTAINPTHVYTTSGTYFISLTGISSTTGCPATYIDSIVILPEPIIQFTATPQQGCSPLTVTFNNTSIGASYYQWIFGDGNFSNLANPTHTFTNSSHTDVMTYTVQLYGENTIGCAADTAIFTIDVHPTPLSDFDIQITGQCDGQVTVQFNNQSIGSGGSFWNLGNGTSSTETNPIVSYTTGTYTVSLTTSNIYGCTDTNTQSFTIYDAPIAEFITNEPCYPYPAIFNNSSINTNTYYWDFGDGNTSTAVHPMHIYDSVGTYQVTLIASMDGVCWDTISYPITVLPSPTASFTVEKLDSLYLGFINNSIGGTKYYWNFGDGDTSTLQYPPPHQYDSNGTYTITLIVENEVGCQDTMFIIVETACFSVLYVPNMMYAGCAGVDGCNTPNKYCLFKPDGVGVENLYVGVFDKWGNCVYQAEVDDIHESPCWNGISQLTDNYAQQGAYRWQVRYRNPCEARTIVREGWLNVLRRE